MTKERYQNLGASATKDGLHAVLDSSGLADASGLFAPVLPDAAGDPKFRSFLHCDGAGTKSIAAYLHFKETADRGIFAGLAQDALVMNLDDVYCIGRPQSLQLANLLARNAKLIDDKVIGVIIARYKELCETLASFGIPLSMGGGETADCGDVVRTLLVDAVLSGRIAADELIRAEAIRPGDVIVGFSSTGRASYESSSNSGIGSNGLTLARHCLLSKQYAERFPECLDPAVDRSIAYQGPYRTTDTEPGLEMSIGEALASPTRTYAPVLHTLYGELPGRIHGVIHLTGGAHTKVLRFGRGKLFEKDNLFPVPKLFSLIREHGKIDAEEMYRVFNMGQRMEVYVEETDAERVIAAAAAQNIDAEVIGRVCEHPDGPQSENEVRITGELGEFRYRLGTPRQ